MGFERDLVVGVIVLAIALVAIASPFLLYVSGRVSPSDGGVNVTDVESLISSIADTVTHFKFMSFSFGKTTLVKEEVINVTGPLKLNILVKGGGVSVLEWGEEGKVKVDVLREENIISFSKLLYGYKYMNGTLNITAVNYVIRVYVPPNYVKSINAEVSGGGLEVSVADANTLRTLNATISGGGVDLKLGKLMNFTMVMTVSSGGLDGHLSFLGDVEHSASSIKVSVAGGGADLRVDALNHFFKVKCSASGGAANVAVRGERHATVNGSATYEDPNYVNASRKLYLDIMVSGGGADVWVSG